MGRHVPGPERPPGAAGDEDGRPARQPRPAPHDGRPVTRTRHSRAGGNPEAANKVSNRPCNLATLLPALRVNRTLHLATLATLCCSAQGHGLLPAKTEQGVQRIHKLGAGAIGQVHVWALSRRRGPWLLRSRQSCNQRTGRGRDRERGAMSAIPQRWTGNGGPGLAHYRGFIESTRTACEVAYRSANRVAGSFLNALTIRF